MEEFTPAPMGGQNGNGDGLRWSLTNGECKTCVGDFLSCRSDAAASIKMWREHAQNFPRRVEGLGYGRLFLRTAMRHLVGYPVANGPNGSRSVAVSGAMQDLCKRRFAREALRKSEVSPRLSQIGTHRAIQSCSICIGTEPHAPLTAKPGVASQTPASPNPPKIN